LRFNPWRFTDENQLLENFFFTLAEKLDGRIETKGEKVADLMRKYSAIAAPLEVPKISVHGIDLGLNLEEVLTKVSQLKPKAGLEELRSRIEKILAESDRKVVVLIDDVDRLDKDEIQAVFRLVKLSADFPNMIYLLSFDLDRVCEALGERFGGEQGARSFLEKIIQLSLSLPRLAPDKLIKLAFTRINELLSINSIEIAKNRDGDWSYFFHFSFRTIFNEPEVVKKYINNLSFSMGGMKEEIDILDFQTIEAIHTFIPKLYDLIRNNREVFLVQPTAFFGGT
jgi:predicted KAP-like P-loop ATPase